MNKFDQQSKTTARAWLTRLVLLGCLSILTACGGEICDGGGNGPTPPPPSNPVILQVLVSGLTGPGGLVLQNNGADSLSIYADGLYQFSKLVPQNSAYSVTVAVTPEGNICTVSSGGKGIAGTTSPVVKVVCATIQLKVGGTVKGLIPGTSVTLLNNNTDVATVTATNLNEEIPFTFQPVAFNSGYTVTVSEQPSGQICTVAPNSSQEYITKAVTDISVICSTEESAYTVSGKVSGLTAGKVVTLQNNNDDFTTIDGNGDFSFKQKIAHLSGYNVAVKNQPDGLTCTVNHSWGFGVIKNINTVQVVCSETTFNIGGRVTGLNPNTQVTLTNNMGDRFVVRANGDGKFAFNVAKESSYLVSVAVQPDNQVCSQVANYKQSNVTADVTNIAFICSTQWFTVGGTLTGLESNNQITINNNGSESQTLYKDGSFTFQTPPVALGGSYDVSIETPMFLQGCEVTNGTGTGVNANVNMVAVSCQKPVFSFLYDFNFNLPYGTVPAAKLIQGGDGTFYGTTSAGAGTVFKTTLQGNPVTVATLSSFGGGNSAPRTPVSELVLGRDGNVFGTTIAGGLTDAGTIFMINPANGAMTVVYSFDGATSGSNLISGLIEDSASAGVFYGTASEGGQHGNGTVFKITVDPVTKIGTLDMAFLHSFNAVNGEGKTPSSTLVRDTDSSGRDLYYGTTRFGGALNDGGTIFTITPDGVLTFLYSFQRVLGLPSNEGFDPQAPVVKGRDGNFYGTTYQGGLGEKGTLFQFNPKNNTLKTVVHFQGSSPGNTGLVLGSDGSFYGTSNSFSGGQIFRYTPPLTNAPDDMGKIESLYTITGAESSFNTLMQSLDGDLYGTSQTDGAFRSGTIFKIGR